MCQTSNFEQILKLRDWHTVLPLIIPNSTPCAKGKQMDRWCCGGALVNPTPRMRGERIMTLLLS